MKKIDLFTILKTAAFILHNVADIMVINNQQIEKDQNDLT